MSTRISLETLHTIPVILDMCLRDSQIVGVRATECGVDGNQYALDVS